MKNSTDVTLQTADCLVRKSAIGHDVVTNICTGEVQNIPWQAGDWIWAVVLLGLFFAAIYMAWAIATDRV